MWFEQDLICSAFYHGQVSADLFSTGLGVLEVFLLENKCLFNTLVLGHSTFLALIPSRCLITFYICLISTQKFGFPLFCVKCKEFAFF